MGDRSTEDINWVKHPSDRNRSLTATIRKSNKRTVTAKQAVEEAIEILSIPLSHHFLTFAWRPIAVLSSNYERLATRDDLDHTGGPVND